MKKNIAVFLITILALAGLSLFCINASAVMSPAYNDFYNILGGVLNVDTVDVNAAEIVTLYSSPKELVAAPGTHNVIEFEGATIFYDYAGAAYGGEDVNVMCIKYKSTGAGNAASSTLAGTGFLTASGSTVARLIPVAVAATASGDIENQPLVLYMAAADPNDGAASAAAGTLRVVITYKILPSGF